ncbi:cilia- and flagella-associated protein 99-like [Physella acuta]|uniref:cilia- and flagella-associated protein 99-like n=1 Tax=Physella acuta TaxID=109671 RepID=UPI0027DB9E7B|nr:cilia- and flagella-associated protein 99-like [Physella acuta]
MDAKHQQLITHCARLLDLYDAETTGVDEHVDGYLSENRILDDDDVIFIKEVFTGCVRHKAVMNVVVDGFYSQDGRNILRSTQNMFIVIAYLALFRLDELGVSHFRKFISALDINTAFKFLNFMFDEKSLATWMKDSWNLIYESAYVQTNILSPLQRWIPELKDLLKLMKNKIDNKLKPKKPPVQVTEVKPFNLTKPRPRSIPIPNKIPKLMKSKPPPPSLYKPPLLQEMLAKQREENRRQAEDLLMDSSKIQFACANNEKTEKTKQILEDIVANENAKVDPNRIKARPLPDFKSNVAPVKMTAAAIMREALLYQKQENEVMEKLRKLEAGSYDDTFFNKWQTEMKQKDTEWQLMAVEERRLMGKLSHEEAILARANVMAENQARVQTIKKESAEIMREYLDKKFKEEQEMRTLVENTMAGHKNAKEAKKKLKEYKRQIVQEVTEESRELMRQALEEAEAEMRCKMELIQQIRVMESTPVNRVKMVDLAATSGMGLLNEMSILELRERLALLKAQNKEDEEIKRDIILNAKQAKAEYLSDTLDMIAKHRSEQTRAAALKLEESRRTKPPAGPQFKSSAVLELEKKLEVKRMERLAEQQKNQRPLSQTPSRKMANLIPQKKAIEARRWQELEQAQERAAKLSSQSQLIRAATLRLAAAS